MGTNTIAADSCAAELNGEMYVFGGNYLFLDDMPGIRRQVFSSRASFVKNQFLLI